MLRSLSALSFALSTTAHAALLLPSTQQGLVDVDDVLQHIDGLDGAPHVVASSQTTCAFAVSFDAGEGASPVLFFPRGLSDGPVRVEVGGTRQGLAYAPLRDVVAVCTEVGSAELRDGETGTLMRTLRHGPEGAVSTCAFSHDGSSVMLVTKDGRAAVWNTDPGGDVIPTLFGDAQRS
jgi:hypothetical protein